MPLSYNAKDQCSNIWATIYGGRISDLFPNTRKYTLNTIVAFDAIIVLVIPSIALLTPSPVMWRKYRFWNFSVPKENKFPIMSR
jgi:hypothetical protein